MKFLLYLSIILACCEAYSMEWFCRKSVVSKHRPIASQDCSDKGSGNLFCKEGSSRPKRCGRYETRDGQLVGTYKLRGSKESITKALAAFKPPAVVEVEEGVEGNSEVTSGRRNRRNRRTTADSGFNNAFPPRSPVLSRSFETSVASGNKEWLEMSFVQQGQYIHSKYQVLINAHQMPFTPNLLTCKAFRESMTSCGYYNKARRRRENRASCVKRGWPITKKFFNPQKITSDPGSTAAGVGQVTKSTAIDQFNRGTWFRSKVPGFEHINDGETFYNKMGSNMLAQMEFGMAILRQKQKDGGISGERSTLAAYYGSGSKTCNNDYADRVLKCKACMDKAGVTSSCLDKALGSRSGC